MPNKYVHFKNLLIQNIPNIPCSYFAELPKSSTYENKFNYTY